jgi:flagellar capping protein FliD
MELTGVSDKPVTLTVTQNADSVIEQAKKFAEDFNGLVDKIDEFTKFDLDPTKRGLLLGDGTVSQVQSTMYQVFLRALPSGASVRTLRDVGFSIDSESKIQFDEEKFKTAYAANPQAVQDLFTQGQPRATTTTSLFRLNDGAGVRTRTGGGADFRITLRNGSFYDVSLAGATTLGSVIERINTAVGTTNLTVGLNETGTALTFTDRTAGVSRLAIQPQGDSQAAADLGINGTAPQGARNFTGRALTMPLTATGKGFGFQIEDVINRLIDPVDGVLSRQNRNLDNRIEQFNDRIDSIDRQLEGKRTRLERQFANLESVLSKLQDQQGALGQLASLPRAG